MTQRSGSSASDFKDLAPAVEELEVQLALAQLTLSLLKLQILGATKGTTGKAIKKTYAQATSQMIMTPTALQTSTFSGNLQNKPSSDGDKMQVGQQG
jgi:hypothetical protein